YAAIRPWLAGDRNALRSIEPARVHHATRRRGGDVAAGGEPGKRKRAPMMQIEALDVRIRAEIIHNWGWFLAFGVGLVLLGILAMVRAGAATVVSILFLGWLRVIAAGIEVAQAIMVGKWAGLYHHWLAAVLFGVVGALMIWRPVASAEVLTLL